jgi:hypothetical protein
MHAAAALELANARPVELGVSFAPPRPGLYALHASATVWSELRLGGPPDQRPLYVGKSDSSLAGRDVRDHFGFVGEGRATSVTGYSTVRRSLAALLHDSRDLRGVPRNPSRPGNFANFGLSPADDDLLSAWMRDRLQLACWEKPDGCSLEQLECIERAVFRRLLPPLNLKHVRTPWKPQIDAARKVMSAEARVWRL